MVPVFLYATLGDCMYTLLAVAGVALYRRDFVWFRAASARDYLLLAGVGLGIALFVETKAMMLQRWEYTDAMPLVYGFGLSPLVQMAILLPLSVFVAARIQKWFNGRND
jgi:hypothetical protein